jgi:GTP-binding protein
MDLGCFTNSCGEPYLGRQFELIDTGGIIPNDEEMIPSEILKQARVALEKAAHIIYLIDGRTEITGAERDLARTIQRLGKAVSLAVNKIDSAKTENLTHDFYSLGFSSLFPVSAEHRIGLDDLLEHVTAGFPKQVGSETDAPKTQIIKVAIIGHPNVGKSTLLNAVVGEERSIVSPIAGTTRDAVDEKVIHNGTEFLFVDTAGIRRKGKTRAMAEKLSVVMARKHISMANVVVVVIDAIEDIVALDATIAGYAHEEGRAVIICVNKWDAASGKDKNTFAQAVRDEMKFLAYAPISFASAKDGSGVERLFGLIRAAYGSASKHVTTGELNRFIQFVDFNRDIKIRYMTQASVRPPTFVAFTDKTHDLHFSTERYLINQLRKRFGFHSTPIIIKPRRR